MEAIDDEPSVTSTVDGVKLSVVSDGATAVPAEADLCLKSNGVAESADAMDAAASDVVTAPDGVAAPPEPENALVEPDATEVSAEPDTVSSLVPEAEVLAAIETTAAVENLLGMNNTCENIPEEIIVNSEETVDHDSEITLPLDESIVEVDSVEMSIGKVEFKTEILVEKNDEVGRDPDEIMIDGHDNANNILSDLGQGIELSEALRSSDTTENVENNNCTGRQEVFNKEELLDILEGNDEAPSCNMLSEMSPASDHKAKKILEAQIALKQLSRLKRSRYRKKSASKSFDKPPRKKKGVKKENNVDSENISSQKENSNTIEESSNTIIDENIVAAEESDIEAKDKKHDSIVNVLKDWDDDDPSEVEPLHSLLEDSKNLLKTSEQLVESQEGVTSQEEVPTRTSTDSPLVEGQMGNLNKNSDDSQPQRRLGRVIKKKVIFDPDNPDTFTKGKIVSKNKESSEKEQPPSKKIKSEQTSQRSKSKSPISKLQWKKPPPKTNNKQNKRLTEVDKLLMDEGAVNMIYQLTPEAPKGKKNMKTKAEFIKKIQSSTPDGKEMKFRERKKEMSRSEEGEPKKIIGGKRSSLSSSVKSPSVCEDFETHSADDSIIYRRHSSSSYSSTCMSPRQLSDVEAGATHGSARASRQPSVSNHVTLEAETGEQVADVFMADVSTSSNEIINKDDCLSIKEKLNTKLSLALNKRKRDSTKTDKPSKQKKLLKVEGKNESLKKEKADSFKYLSINFDQRLAEICIGKTGSSLSVKILKELEEAIVYVESRKDISVTLLTSECGTLCSDLDLRPLLNDDVDKRTNYASELAESVRSVLCSVERHSKLVVSGAWGACSGVALALLALSDVALASERASFALGRVPLPGVAALTERSRPLPQSLVNDLVVFGRRLSAAEAVKGGLVSRALWPGGGERLRDLARDLAAQPSHSILLKKQLLNLKKSAGAETTFLSSLERERDVLVEYWTSAEGREALRAALDASAPA